MASTDYSEWTKDALVQRIRDLEAEIKSKSTGGPPPSASTSSSPFAAAHDDEAQPKRRRRRIDPSRYSTRVIALKLAYLGKNYGGFEHQASATATTIEAELWKAMVKSCLIFPASPDVVDFEPWEYAKCGRTDKGVSAFGQVISIRVRSSKPLSKTVEVHDTATPDEGRRGGRGEKGQLGGERVDEGSEVKEISQPAWDPVVDELDYCTILNRILPHDIRILAWCPSLPPDFSARLSCRERQYRYFFTQPAYAPPALGAPADGMAKTPPQPLSTGGMPATDDGGWLDMDAMRKAANMFEGVHDFRNFCKVDPGKQISNYMRRIYEADIVEVEGAASSLPFLWQARQGQESVGAASGRNKDDDSKAAFPKVYYFHVRGSAFLWHQIRHMAAVLFLVGQGIECPSIVAELLDVARNPGRPVYNMADEVPLVLWDCIFPDLREEANSAPQHDPDLEAIAGAGDKRDALDWVWHDGTNPINRVAGGGVLDHLWATWREHKMDEVLAGRLLSAVAARRREEILREERSPTRQPRRTTAKKARTDNRRLFEGGNGSVNRGRHVPLLQRPRQQPVEQVNDAWARAQGFASSLEMTSQKNWRSLVRANKERKKAQEAAGKDEMAVD